MPQSSFQSSFANSLPFLILNSPILLHPKHMKSLLFLLLISAPLIGGDKQPPITRLACGSCHKPKPSSPIWKSITADKPQGFIFMGDNIYADTEDPDVMRRRYKSLVTLPDYAAFAATTPIYPTWDDHDYGKNDAGAEYPMKKQAQEIFFNTFNFPNDHPARKTPGVYHSTTMGPKGKRLQIILLDTRYFRTPNILVRENGRKKYYPQTDKNATMLGSAQWDWLKKQLHQPADLRILVSSIQVIPTNHRFEKWANMPNERARLFNLLRDTKAGPTILLSGDRHLAEISTLAPAKSGLNFPLVELTSSGMTHAGASSYPSDFRIKDTYYSKRNYGLIDIDWSPKKPIVTLPIKSHQGTPKKLAKVTF